MRIDGPVHFVGIGGAGQRATAELLLGQGVRVGGSDVNPSPILVDLAARGATVHTGHAASHLDPAARLVVVSSAVPEGNPEVAAARERGVEVVKNAELLRRIGAGRRTLAVAGTHGKTTTTSMLAWTCVQAGLDPACIVGGEVRNLGASGRAGDGPWFVVEADEYDRRFLALDPWVAVVLNLEPDHLDYYGSAEQLTAAFRQFVAAPPTDGCVVLCADDPGAAALAPAARAPVVTYGLEQGDWQAREIEVSTDATSFVIVHRGQAVARCTLRVVGLHNVRNALACCAAAAHAGVAPETTAAALGEFRGAGRRFELVGEAGGVAVISDYGHLPAEVRAVIAAARQRYPGRRLWAVFQPHTYARTRLWMAEFAAACREADEVRIVGAYVPSGRETVHADAETQELAEHAGAPYLPGQQAVPAALAPELRPGDVVLLIGAGDIDRAAGPLLAALGRAA
jgi:UDP-N-acetylmuramate--alanine ligase